MAHIHIRMYSDGFYALSAQVGGRTVSVKYSETTERAEAIKDFERVLADYERMVKEAQ